MVASDDVTVITDGTARGAPARDLPEPRQVAM
jgi:hypothetical protein